MKKFYSERFVKINRVKQLARFIKKYKQFGAYLEVTERDSIGYYDVELFCPVTHIDILGNRAIVPTRPTRMTLDHANE